MFHFELENPASQLSQKPRFEADFVRRRQVGTRSEDNSCPMRCILENDAPKLPGRAKIRNEVPLASHSNAQSRMYSRCSSLTIPLTMAPRSPTQAPAESTLGSVEETTKIVRLPGSRTAPRKVTSPDASCVTRVLKRSITWLAPGLERRYPVLGVEPLRGQETENKSVNP